MSVELSDFKGIGLADTEDGLSLCCGAGTYGDILICEDCGEHCG